MPQQRQTCFLYTPLQHEALMQTGAAEPEAIVAQVTWARRRMSAENFFSAAEEFLLGD
jgi:hypothetical protein